MVPVSVRVSITVIKHHDQKALGEKKRFISAYSAEPTLHRSGKSGQNSRQELKQKPWRNGVFWLARFSFFLRKGFFV